MIRHTARWALGCAVRHWPIETRKWGEALSSELEETNGTWDTLQWALGGMMLFARSWLASGVKWLKLPVGGLGGAPNGLRPRRSRLVTLVMVTGTAGVLCLPTTQDAIRMLRGVWAFDPRVSERPRFAELAARAEKENDAEALAFVALSAEEPEQFDLFADRAIMLDPSLVWLYAAKRRFWGQRVEVRREPLARLRAADPKNAVPYLLEADIVIGPVLRAAHRTWDEVKAAAASNSEWMSLMSQAVAASSYDSYSQRHFRLVQDMLRRERWLSPWVAEESMWLHAGPRLHNLRLYGDIQADQAEQAAAKGNLTKAEQTIGTVESFGERIAVGNSTTSERMFGFWVAHDAEDKLSKTYGTAGMKKEADEAASRAQQFQERASKMSTGKRAMQEERKFGRVGILVYTFGCLTILSGIAVMLTVVVLELCPAKFLNKALRKVLCWTADHVPAALILCSCGFLLSFLPYEGVLEAYRASSDANTSQLMIRSALTGLTVAPNYVLDPLRLWPGVIVLLSAVGAFMVARGVYRWRTKHA